MTATALREPSPRTPSTLEPDPFGDPGLDTQPTQDADRVRAAADAILAQSEQLLQILPVEAYRHRLPEVFHGSIGGHVRHCLEHFQSLIDGWDRAHVDYDHRARDVRLELEPEQALRRTRLLRARLRQIRSEELFSPVTVRCEVSYAHGDSPVTHSSVGREFVYAIAHAIHHFALISVMARLQDLALPAEFGVAPSTVAHQRTAGTQAGS